MAKLNVVIPAVEVTVDGVTYRKVDRKAQAGDIAKALESLPDIDRGAFYGPVTGVTNGKIEFADNDEFPRSRPITNYEVYAPISEPAAVEYREVKRKAVVGERIRITNRVIGEDRYGDGDEFAVNSVDSDGDVRVNAAGSDRTLVLRREYVVLEPVSTKPAEPERLKVGDYARVVAGHFKFRRDEIVKITEVDTSDETYRAKRETESKEYYVMFHKLVRATDEEVAKVVAAKRTALIAQFSVGDNVRLISGGGTVGVRDYVNGEVYTVKNPKYDSSPNGIQITGGGQPTAYVRPDQIVKLTAEEVAEIERKQAEEAAKRVEEAKWNAIGRKVNEYKRGDIVEVTVSCGGHAVGTIGELVSGAHFPIPTEFGVLANGVTKCHLSAVKLVTPVEQRFDRVEEVDAA